MGTSDAVRYHLIEALRAAITEDEHLARRLRAETRMRLVSMSDDDLWELTRATCPPQQTFEAAYASFKEAVDNLKASASEWMKDLENYDNVQEIEKGDKRSLESLKE